MFIFLMSHVKYKKQIQVWSFSNNYEYYDLHIRHYFDTYWSYWF